MHWIRYLLLLSFEYILLPMTTLNFLFDIHIIIHLYRLFHSFFPSFFLFSLATISLPPIKLFLILRHPPHSLTHTHSLPQLIGMHTSATKIYRTHNNYITHSFIVHALTFSVINLICILEFWFIFFLSLSLPLSPQRFVLYWNELS